MRKFTLIAALVGGLVISPVFASAPSQGTVVEGVLVPGFQLGDSREQVEWSIGAPQFCQSADVAGDRGSCSFPVDGGGSISVRFRGADGGNAGNSPDDVVRSIRWYEQVSGWVTTAGIDTGLAASDPKAVTDAYPDADVTYNMFGDIYRVVDSDLGIEITWVLDFYSGVTHVNMAIFSPVVTPPPPPPAEQTTHIAAIDLSSRKSKRQRRVSAVVEIRNESGGAASEADVQAAWILPDGGSLAVQDKASTSGFAHFEVEDDLRGAYTLRITGVELEGHVFDADNSILEATISVK